MLNKLVALALASLAAAACTPATTLEQTWTTPAARTSGPLTSIVTVFHSDNETIRRAGEDQLARDLIAKGVRATPSYAVIGPNEKVEDEATKSKLLTMGYDGMVVMAIVDRYQELEYSPSTFDYGWGYGWGYGYGYGAPYTETVVRVETRAYSLRTNQLVWSALTKTEGDDAADLIDDTSSVVAGALTRRGLAG